ncbi:MAG: hypothetical protein HOP13_03550 [Alphaproteobacteria bacterium]|nr:hypothetical protein [Alphaproteobacteria bacterium]
MKHAGPAALDELEPLLAQLRTLPRLREKKRGTFYVGAKAFLHFHEDPAGPFADLKLSLDGDYERFRVRTAVEHARLVTLARRVLA